MTTIRLDDKVICEIKEAVEHFKQSSEKFEPQVENLYNFLIRDKRLTPYIHSSKFRLKKLDSLYHKLERKAIEAITQEKEFDINASNLFEKIGDLCGIRLLHLHTNQIKQINPLILTILDENFYKIREGPIANTWDYEYEKYFEILGITTASRESMYTSIHYVIESNSRFKILIEIQVRTLMEEVWGEVSHKIDYPDRTESISCQEQIKVLARMTSGCTRLVDSIFKSHEEFGSFKPKG